MERLQDDPARDAAIERAVSIMEWESPAIPGVFNPTIEPGQEVVPDARQVPTHPLRKGNQ